MKKHYGIIDMIHPTQVAVGYAEVAVKMEELFTYEKEAKLEKYIASKPIPCVLGPDGIIYITDHHHMGLALTVLANEWEKENSKKAKLDNPYIHCVFNILYDFSKSKLPKKEFFKVLDSLEFLHSYDENGIKIENDIPRRLIDLKNDPYRSLAGFVRKSGGYAKVDKHYIEFTWADFFRDKITKQELEQDFNNSVIKGIALALSDEAKNLPGWTGIEIVKKLKNSTIEKIKSCKKEATKINIDIEESIMNAKNNATKTSPIKFK
jgi:hypothetical protein